ncbi:MAG: hypothetical protein JXB07_06115 [Anaerolineae bacterium]|nr:hypothetical protein [Anaerolineae bacterium]
MGDDQINAKRRRKGSGPVGRAEEPRRDTGSVSSGSSGGGLPRPSLGSGLPSRGKQVGGCGTILIILLFIGYYLLTNGQGVNIGTGGEQDYGQGGSGLQQPPASNFTPPVPATSGNQTWTVMLYQDADDQVLERDIYLDLNEAERVGSSPNVNIVAQLDRFHAGYQGDGDWTSARRYYVTQDNDLRRIGSQMVQDLGEVNMSSPQTLVDFVQWSAQKFPADKYVLIISDHGMGWPGGWSDPSHEAPGSSIPLAERLGNNLYLMELDQALGDARATAGIDKFEIFGMDACLMSQIEVMAAIQPHANYAVASEEIEPAIGWAYAGFLGKLVQNPDMSGVELSKAIVDGYIIDDQRIQDPAERAEFLRGGSPLGALFGGGALASADQLATQMSYEVTLTAVDLQALPDLMTRYNNFAYQLRSDNQQLVAQARSHTQSYTSVFGSSLPPSYIDLGHFVLLMQANTSDNQTRQTADAVIAALKKTIIAEKHGAGRKGSTGLAVYFPNSQLYSSPLTGPQSYTAIANRFASGSLWDDFLAYHYLERDFSSTDVTPYIPPSGYSARAPGAGDITLSEITVSSNQAAPDQPVTLSVDIQGSNIGYIYLFAGYFEQAASSLNITDIDYLESTDTRELNGVYYPVWKEDGFTLNFTWDPIVFAVSDGSQNAVALFQPEQYGVDADSAVYTVEGLYTFAQTGESQYAILRFRSGALVAVYGFTGEGVTGAPHEITPAQGDTFTISEKWLDMDAGGNVIGQVKEDGKTLTFGSEPFQWVELYAAAGEYAVGFIVEDLDGKQYPVYTRMTVK